EPLEGQVFLGKPLCGPCSAADAQAGRMIRLFIEAQGAGVTVKLAGTVSVDPSTGQLTTSFRDNPQLPFSDLKLTVQNGPSAPLANPRTCGPATTSSDLTPWSAGPGETPDATPSSSFAVDWDGAGGPCPTTLPFSPGFLAQTALPAAGEFTPFTVALTREDR